MPRRSLCVGYSEVNKYSIEVYQKHFSHKNYGDATRIIPEQIPDFDLLVGGFPCQAFSIAGKRGGFEDTRGTLFFEIARIISIKRPKLCLLENVRGLLSHDKGRTFRTILTTLAGLGYWWEYQILNSKNFGVPQNRERVFLVGHLGEPSGGQVFPITSNGKADIELPTLTARYWEGQANGSYLREITTKGQSQGMRVYDSEGISTTIASQAGGLGAKTGLYRVHNLQPRSGNPKKGGTGPLNRDDGNAYCLDTGNTQAVEKESRIRRLTPTECERLQGFPDGWTEHGTTMKISDSQRYKMLGNAITTNVAQAIIKKINECGLLQ